LRRQLSFQLDASDAFHVVDHERERSKQHADLQRRRGHDHHHGCGLFVEHQRPERLERDR
jgi:hypothetical protein